MGTTTTPAQGSFTAEERAAVKERAKEVQAATRRGSTAQKAAEAERRLKQRGTQAEYGAPSARAAQPPKRARRVRLVIGSADGVENLFPRQQK
jgi:hypothetical protein